VFVATVVLGIVVGLGFFVPGIAKLTDVAQMARAREHLGIEPGLFKAVGLLEVLGAIGVLAGLYKDLPVIGVLAAVGLVAMTIGAVFYHQRADDSIGQWIPAVAMGSIAIVYIILRVGTA